MSAEDLPAWRRIRRIRQALNRVLMTVAGIVGGLFCYFVCQGMFAGYPEYGTNILSYVALFLITATGGIAWYLDERRSHDD